MVEKVSDKGAHGARVGGRAEGQEEERKIEACNTRCGLAMAKVWGQTQIRWGVGYLATYLAP